MQKYDFQLDIYYHSIIFVHIAKSSKERHCERSEAIYFFGMNYISLWYNLFPRLLVS